MTEQDKSKYGKLALMLTLGGVVIAIVIGMLVRLTGHNADTSAYLIFLSFQVAAIVLGLITRRTPLGKAAAITAGLLSVGTLTLLASEERKLR